MEMYRVAIAGLIQSGHITRFDQIFLKQKMPRAAFAHELGMEPKLIYASIKNPAKLTIVQIYRMASYFAVNPDLFLTLVTNQVNQQQKEKGASD